ncbi:MAG: hypothetical protein IJC56_05920 [Clostridia bacterium]|nr:hypothetical protein [Clostridia bacterium]
MYVQLPPIEDRILPIPHFPAPFQCVIFRNWGIVPVSRIAAVIGASKAQICESAAQLGLSGGDADPAWLEKGYITIIRMNWHLLSYEQLCTLLGWSMEKLSFTLREDDFLDVKLGNFKPVTPDVTYRPLTADEQRRTIEIRKIVGESLSKLPPVTAAPFDFAPRFLRPEITASGSRFRERIVYSYCSLYGDAFSDRRLLDESFPDELLASYQSLGITGIWTHVVLYQITPFLFDEKISDGWRTRLSGIAYLTEKLAKYGIKLFLYFNEPRAMPEAFFESHPGLRGAKMGEFSTMCIRHPAVQDYLSKNVALICEKAPLLGGFFTITASENLTNCHSHFSSPALTPCPRCADESPASTYALVNSIIRAAAPENVQVVAWTWGWPQEATPEVVKLLPDGVSVMNVSEQAVKKLIGGTETSVLDYSISVEGPGEYAISTWNAAHAAGHSAFAKLQLNNSWEMSAVPCIPVFERIYRHLKRLAELGDACPDGLFLSWSLGGCPSPTLALVSACSGEKLPALEDIYRRIFPGCNIPLLTHAIHLFSEAFDAYPFHIGSLYSGPQQCAPANLLHAAPTGFNATMVCFPHDHLDGWRSIFPRETYIDQLKKLSDTWIKGLPVLKNACIGCENDPMVALLADCAEVCACHFRSMYLESIFISRRDGLAVPEDAPDMHSILIEEESIALRTAAVQARNPFIGYESSNHYYYTRGLLIEKVINCRHIAQNI